MGVYTLVSIASDEKFEVYKGVWLVSMGIQL